MWITWCLMNISWNSELNCRWRRCAGTSQESTWSLQMALKPQSGKPCHEWQHLLRLTVCCDWDRGDFYYGLIPKLVQQDFEVWIQHMQSSVTMHSMLLPNSQISKPDVWINSLSRMIGIALQSLYTCEPDFNTIATLDMGVRSVVLLFGLPHSRSFGNWYREWQTLIVRSTSLTQIWICPMGKRYAA